MLFLERQRPRVSHCTSSNSGVKNRGITRESLVFTLGVGVVHYISALKLVAFSVLNGICDELIQEMHSLMFSLLEETLLT